MPMGAAPPSTVCSALMAMTLSCTGSLALFRCSTNSPMPPLYWNVSLRPPSRSSVSVMRKPALRNESSRRRLARMSYWNSVVVKIVGSGLKVIFVPVRSLLPMTDSGATGTPRRYSWKWTWPSRRISILSHSLTALTALTPTPCSPALTL